MHIMHTYTYYVTSLPVSVRMCVCVCKSVNVVCSRAAMTLTPNFSAIACITSSVNWAASLTCATWSSWN